MEGSLFRIRIMLSLVAALHLRGLMEEISHHGPVAPPVVVSAISFVLGLGAVISFEKLVRTQRLDGVLRWDSTSALYFFGMLAADAIWFLTE